MVGQVTNQRTPSFEHSSVQEELRVLDGSIFRGLRAVGPAELCDPVVQLPEEGHFGIGKGKQRCRDAGCYRGIDSQFRDVISNCEAEHAKLS